MLDESVVSPAVLRQQRMRQRRAVRRTLEQLAASFRDSVGMGELAPGTLVLEPLTRGDYREQLAYVEDRGDLWSAVVERVHSPVGWLRALAGEPVALATTYDRVITVQATFHCPARNLRVWHRLTRTQPHLVDAALGGEVYLLRLRPV